MHIIQSHWCDRRRLFLLEDDEFIFSHLEEMARDEERQLGPNSPIAPDIMAIHKGDALDPDSGI